MNKHATRKRNIFNPDSTEPFDLSRSKVDLFIRCPRCFYLDRRLGVAPPRGFPFNINEAVDLLFKREFDTYRKNQKPHPLVEKEGLRLIPFQHQDMDTWRNPFVGIRHHHPESNFTMFGGVDDIWIDPDGALVVVDYKATSKDEEVTIDKAWQRSYKHQIEMYQWLLRRNGFTVSDTGYFVYTNADRSAQSFDDVLQFRTKLIPYTGDDSWIEDTLLRAKSCLLGSEVPSAGEYCDFCPYRDAAGKSFRFHITGRD